MAVVAEFEVQYTQYLSAQAKVNEDLPEFAQSAQTLIELYQHMCQLRAYDTKAVALQRTGKMGTYASTLGQEAISVAIGHAMRSEDVLSPFYRDYGAMLQRGIKMSEIYTYWGGDERGSCYQNNQQDLPITVPIASQCLLGVGVASAFRYRNEKRVCVITCGDGATSQGDFYEAMNVAGAWQLPAVFVVNNNQWAISVPLSAQTACKTLAQKAIAAGFTGEQVDGNDVIAMRDAVGRAIEKARRGGGPTLIEALTYRLCDHTTADDASRYRSSDEVETAWQQEPIARMQKYLMAESLWDEDKEAELMSQCDKAVETAVAEYMDRPKQAVTDMFDYHYAELPDALIEQRQMALEDV